jgi:hypothetical protein
LWYVTRSHPEFDGWLIFPTATINLTGDQSEVTSLNFSSGIKQTGENFLDRLYAAYQAVQAIRKTTFVPAWELRAVFCYQNRCQASVFNQLFAANYLDSDEYELHLEIERQRPRHEKEPLKAGRTSVGSMRVSRR